VRQHARPVGGDEREQLARRGDGLVGDGRHAIEEAVEPVLLDIRVRRDGLLLALCLEREQATSVAWVPSIWDESTASLRTNA
jgi:hypothetical protein